MAPECIDNRDADTIVYVPETHVTNEEEHFGDTLLNDGRVHLNSLAPWDCLCYTCSEFLLLEDTSLHSFTQTPYEVTSGTELILLQMALSTAYLQNSDQRSEIEYLVTLFRLFTQYRTFLRLNDHMYGFIRLYFDHPSEVVSLAALLCFETLFSNES